MDTNKRLERIEAKCKERGWKAGFIECGPFFVLHIPHEGLKDTPEKLASVIIPKTDEWITAIEALLAATDAGGPVVEICTDDEGKCFPCGLWNYDYNNGCGAGLNNSHNTPGEKCPREGKHRLVPVDGGV